MRQPTWAIVIDADGRPADPDLVSAIRRAKPHAVVCAARGRQPALEPVADLVLPAERMGNLDAVARICGVRRSSCLVVTSAGDPGQVRRTIDAWLARPDDADVPHAAMPPSAAKPAVRVVCLDPADRILLLHWRDPVDGHEVWDPPGGKLKRGELPLHAARREVTEETGLPGRYVTGATVPVPRDTVWCGKRYRRTELFYLARVTDPDERRPPRLTGHERATLLGERWWTWDELTASPVTVEPVSLAMVLRSLAPDGPWSEFSAAPRSAGCDRP